MRVNRCIRRRPAVRHPGPGILTNIFDGIERPLKAIAAQSGDFISRGVSVSALDEDKTWDVTVTVKPGDRLTGGSVYATCPETPIILHKCMVPPALSGDVVEVRPDGPYRIRDTIAVLKDAKGTLHELSLCQQWPIRIPRPIRRRLYADRPLITASGSSIPSSPLPKAAPRRFREGSAPARP